MAAVEFVRLLLAEVRPEPLLVAVRWLLSMLAVANFTLLTATPVARLMPLQHRVMASLLWSAGAMNRNMLARTVLIRTAE